MKKKKENAFNSIGVVVLNVLTISLFCVLNADSMMQRIEKIGREEATKIIIDTQVAGLWERTDQRKGLRVHQLREPLADRKSVV